MLAEFSENCTSSPAGMIRCLHANRGWIPLGQSSDSNHFGIDLDPGPSGVVGQVINFGRDQEDKHVLALSWAQFLEDFADELAAGNFVIDEHHPYGSFLVKRPRTEPLSTQYANWSGAKVRPRPA